MVANRNSQAWAEAKKRCLLNDTDIQMAKELGMTPKSLIKNIPAPHQQWKAPVKVWIRDLYGEKFNKAKTGTHVPKEESNRKIERQEKSSVFDRWIDDGDLPF